MLLNKSRINFRWSVLTLGLAVTLTGCQFDTPNRTAQTPMRIQERMVQDIRPTDSIDHAYLAVQADHYYRTGNGPVEIRVTYNPKSAEQNPHWAKSKLKFIRRHLEQSDVAEIDAGILPVKDLARSQTIIRYQSYQAKAPIECDGMADQLNAADPDPEYIIGCTHHSMFAKQLYRHTDLLDKDSADSPDSADRVSSPVDTYRSGARSQAFETITSTSED